MTKFSSGCPVAFAVRIATFTLAAFCIAPATALGTEVTGSVVDAETGRALPCRLYVQSTDTLTWHFAKSADAAGSAVEYRKQIGATPSVEMHVHRTMADLPNLVMAEDLNVALPLNYWVRDSNEIPSASGPVMEARTINVDATHVIRNGEIAQSLTIEPERTLEGAWKYAIDVSETLDGSGWLGLRCFEELPDTKVSFAHTNPVYVDIPNMPLTKPQI